MSGPVTTGATGEAFEDLREGAARAVLAAMSGAEQMTHGYAAGQMRSAESDARALRQQARDLLADTGDLLERADSSGRRAISTLTEMLDDLDEHAALMRALLPDVAVPNPPAAANPAAAIRRTAPGHPAPRTEPLMPAAKAS